MLRNQKNGDIRTGGYFEKGRLDGFQRRILLHDEPVTTLVSIDLAYSRQ